MNRLSSLLALGAIVVAGAFAGTAAQASATPSIAFNVYNDPGSSASMIRTNTSGNISGLITPPAAILPGGYDPASGFRTVHRHGPSEHRRPHRCLRAVCERRQHVRQRVHVQHADHASRR